MSTAARILVVDDERANRSLLEAILVPEGFDVTHASDGVSALELIAAGGIDLVLLDVMMPGIDGIETCRRIRTELAQPCLPVVMVTAVSERPSRIASTRNGADDYLVKPVLEQELLARVRSLLLRSAFYREAQGERARAEAEARRWKLVSDVARTVSVCRDYASLQLAISELLHPTLPLAAFVFLEHEAGALRLPVSSSTASAPMAPSLPTHRWESVWDARSMLRIESCAEEFRPFAPRDLGAHPLHGAVVPLQAGGALQGLLLLFTSRPLARPEESLIEDLAPHLGNAVTNVRALMKAKELNDARDRLSLLLVHDFKNPLGAISMNIELLLAGRMPDLERDDALRDAQAAADRLLQMIVDLLDIGRAEEGRLALQRSVGSIAKTAGHVCSRYAAAAAQRNVTIESNIDADLSVDADHGLLTRVLENLLGNALRYVRHGGHIWLSADCGRDGLVLRVANDGPAIAPAARGRLFEKYGGVETGQTSPNRGLGLYFCRLVAEAHGGSIVAVEPPNGGVIFELRLPRSARFRASMGVQSSERSLPPAPG